MLSFHRKLEGFYDELETYEKALSDIREQLINSEDEELPIPTEIDNNTLHSILDALEMCVATTKRDIMRLYN